MIDISEKYLDMQKTLHQLESEKEYTEYIYTIDKYLEEDDLPMSISFTLNYLAGLMCLKIDDFNMAIPYLMKTYVDYQRIEGVILVVKYYYEIKRYLLAYSLSMVCMMTEKIPDIGCNDFVYDFERYLIHSKICKEIRKYEEGSTTIQKSMGFINKDMPDYEKYTVEVKELFEYLVSQDSK